MLVPLAAATRAACGNKAAALAALLHAGLPVPDGAVIPFEGAEVEELREWLVSAGDPVVAVRSSASDEDTGLASGAGQHDSFLGVRGIEAVVDAVHACRASLWSARATAYRETAGVPSMAVIIQRHLDADVSGVMFTPTDPSAPTLIESSWGLGPSVVEGRITPDRYQILNGSVTSTIADKPTSLTRTNSTLEVRPVPTTQRRTPTLTPATARHLTALGHQAATTFGRPQDVEWAITGSKIWLLQSRPITARLPTQQPAAPTPRTAPGTAPDAPTGPDAPTAHHAPTAHLGRTAHLGPTAHLGLTAHCGRTAPGGPTGPEPQDATLTGTPASQGTATGPARIVRGPADFSKIRPGDILVCPHTDPAWTPLLSIATGVITESGGILSHAAIVAREHAIPAVVSVSRATTRIPDGATVTLNGATGAVHLKDASET